VRSGLFGGVLGAAVAAGAMSVWIAFVNRPFVERFTIIYRSQELHAGGPTIWRREP
jgi:hypothetical protein